jgi:dihydrofolate reductase
MIDIPKVVFTKTLNDSPWVNTSLAKGDITEEVDRLKSQKGKDIVAYGGAGFVSSLVKKDLIDDYYIFVNPTAVGNGLRIFDDINGYRRLKLVESTQFGFGIVVNHYQRA